MQIVVYEDSPRAGQGLPPVVAMLPAFVLVFVVAVGTWWVLRGQYLAGGTQAVAAVAEVAGAQVSAVQTAAAEVGVTQAEAVEAVSLPKAGPAVGAGVIAAGFAPSVQYWAADIGRWAAESGLDPNLVATVMQIESCGDPGAVSSAGAQGLFQVMPFHFAAGEQMQDPDTNAARGMAYLALGLAKANGNAGLAMAGYNGGHSVIGQGSYTWHAETQRYHYWGSNIYAELSADPNYSATLAEWMAAGGASLCAQAEARLGLR